VPPKTGLPFLHEREINEKFSRPHNLDRCDDCGNKPGVNKSPFGKIFCLLAGLLFLTADDFGDNPPASPKSEGLQNYLILTPDLAAATMNNGWVRIPFAVKNNSGNDINIRDDAHTVDLAFVDHAGETKFLQNFLYPRYSGLAGLMMTNRELAFESGGPARRVTLKPGETRTFPSMYRTEMLGAVTGRKLFGVLRGHIPSTNTRFEFHSAPFVIPSSLATLPWNDLGNQNYLVITPDLTKVQRAAPADADSIKNGWAEDVIIPFVVKNTSNQDIMALIEGIDCYIVGKEKINDDMKRVGWWFLLQISAPDFKDVCPPSLKPGESVSSASRCKLSRLEDDGYKPGDKIIAVVYGRIANTNKVFKCYSAPFELPPLPKGLPAGQ
jgi:hypothetical protein